MKMCAKALRRRYLRSRNKMFLPHASSGDSREREEEKQAALWSEQQKDFDFAE